jgi:hypothetical protein
MLANSHLITLGEDLSRRSLPQRDWEAVDCGERALEDWKRFKRATQLRSISIPNKFSGAEHITSCEGAGRVKEDWYAI